MIICRTPLRMSFVGGGSDLPAYYRKKNGAILSTTINKYVYVSVNKKFDDNIRLSYSKTESINNINKIKHPIIKNVLKFLKIKKGIEITSVSDIPSQGSGLGSSSSFTVGLVNSLYKYLNLKITKQELAKLASHIEIDLCKDMIGKQDQYSTSFGGMNLIEFNEDESVNVIPVKILSNTKKKIESSIILFFTGRTRKASDILEKQSKNIQQPNKQKLITNMVDLAYEMKNLIEKNDLTSFGELLDKNWKLKKQLSSEISDEEIDNLYNLGIKAGATGGKLLGAGNGGFIMFYANPDKHLEITKSMISKGLTKVSFSFENTGSKIIFSD
jgi:D-glycero-alpha-D-manno-heptose-7-phosphate kinase|tara:strand:- start:4880 stop:5863 length:984 start_codon:yes stop_codon:yes gene_type:complete